MSVTPLLDAEAWFKAQGLPYFVAEDRRRVHASLRLRRLVPLLVLATAPGVAIALGFGPVLSDDSDSLLLGVGVTGLLLVAYALLALRLLTVLSWAAVYTLAHSGCWCRW